MDLIVVEEIVRSALMGATTTIDLSPQMMPAQIREVITQSQSGGYTMTQRVPYQTGVSLYGWFSVFTGLFEISFLSVPLSTRFGWNI